MLSLITLPFATKLVIATIFGYFGSIINRIRGGDIFEDAVRVHSALLWFSLIFLMTFAPVVSLFTAIGIFIGSTWGWGVGFGATGGYEKKNPLIEIPLLDKFVYSIVTPTYNTTTKEYDPKWKLRLWGTIWMTFRGAIWGVCAVLGYLLGNIASFLIASNFSVSIAALTAFAIGLLNPLLLVPIALFSLMGLVYLATSFIFNNERYIERSEILFGIPIGFAVAFLILFL